MIENLSLSKFNNQPCPSKQKNENSQSFKGLGTALLKGVQLCEQNPMANVAMLDFTTAIIPRSYVDSKTNIHAGFEAFRREASGLFINCLIPGFVALFFGTLFNNLFMGKGANLGSCWAGEKTIDTLSQIYSQSTGNCKDKVFNSYKRLLSDMHGVDGRSEKAFASIKSLNIDETAQKLTDLVFSKDKSSKKIDKIYHSVVEKTHMAEHLKLKNSAGNITAIDGNLKSLFRDSNKFFKALANKNITDSSKISSFAKNAKNLVKAKSIAAFALIIPLASSMQYINRKITEKHSGESGAPIYEDYGQKRELSPSKEKLTSNIKNKDGLLKQKIISVSSMLGVALLSFMKKPSLAMLKDMTLFKGQFPSMDQARAISAITFSSRMAVADDKNELGESTLRDIATFLSFYFLGDYAAKGAATFLEKKHNVTLLNRTKPLPQNAGNLRKLGNWVLHTSLKSTDELASIKTKNLRAACQLTNLGASLLLLGTLIPKYARHQTKKKHERDLKFQQQMENYALDNKLWGNTSNLLP